MSAKLNYKGSWVEIQYFLLDEAMNNLYLLLLQMHFKSLYKTTQAHKVVVDIWILKEDMHHSRAKWKNVVAY